MPFRNAEEGNDPSELEWIVSGWKDIFISHPTDTFFLLPRNAWTNFLQA